MQVHGLQFDMALNNFWAIVVPNPAICSCASKQDAIKFCTTCDVNFAAHAPYKHCKYNLHGTVINLDAFRASHSSVLVHVLILEAKYRR